MLKRDAKIAGLWRGDFRIGSKRIRPKFHAQTQRDAERIYRRIRSEAERNAPPTPSRSERTVQHLADADIERTARLELTEGQRKSLLNHWRNILKILGNRAVYCIRPSDIYAYVESRQKSASGVTIRREVCTLMRGLQHAKRAGWICEVPEAEVHFWGRRSKQRSAGKWHEATTISRFLEALPPDARDLYTVALHTALRSAELYRLTPRQIEEAPPGLSVSKQLRVGMWGAGGERKAKTVRPRVLGLTDEAAAILERRARGADDPLFDLRPDVVRHQALAACKAIGYDRSITLRDMRHFALTCMADTDLLAAQRVGGHSSVQTTSRYLHARERAVLQAGLCVAAELKSSC